MYSFLCSGPSYDVEVTCSHISGLGYTNRAQDVRSQKKRSSRNQNFRRKCPERAAGGWPTLGQMSRWGLKAWSRASNKYVLARERALALRSNVQEVATVLARRSNTCFCSRKLVGCTISKLARTPRPVYYVLWVKSTCLTAARAPWRPLVRWI